MTTVALSDTLSHLAIGLGDGTVILYRHLDQSLASSNSLTSLPKLRTIHESPTEPITGLGFREHPEEMPNSYLFIVTTNHVLCYQVSGKRSGGTPAIVDEIGAGLGCAVMDWKRKDVVVARDEAIYVCNTEGRGNCWAYEGNTSTSPRRSLASTDAGYKAVNPQFTHISTISSSFRLLSSRLHLLQLSQFGTMLHVLPILTMWTLLE